MTEQPFAALAELEREAKAVGWLILTPGPLATKVQIGRWPSAWHRYWQRVFFGFEYEKLK